MGRGRRFVTFIVLGLAALVGAGVGFRLSLASGEIGPSATVDGVTATVVSSGWVDMGHDASMPQTMMPDAPAQGAHRLRVELTFANDGSAPAQLFESPPRVAERGGDSWPARTESLPPLTLYGGQSAGAIALFDLPVGDHGDLVLEWLQGDDAARLALGTASGGGDQHHHTGTEE